MSYLALAKKAEEELRGSAQDDPILDPEQWYPQFREFHHRVVVETPGFDYMWVREKRPGLYRAINAKEKEIDALGWAQLSQIMALLREWRELILTAEFERQRFTR